MQKAGKCAAKAIRTITSKEDKSPKKIKEYVEKTP